MVQLRNIVKALTLLSLASALLAPSAAFADGSKTSAMRPFNDARYKITTQAQTAPGARAFDDATFLRGTEQGTERASMRTFDDATYLAATPVATMRTVNDASFLAGHGTRPALAAEPAPQGKSIDWSRTVQIIVVAGIALLALAAFQRRGRRPAPAM